MTKSLTLRQDKFIFEYAKDGNAAQAAIRAGYSLKGAKVAGHRLLTNANLKQRLNLAARTGLDALERIAKNGKSESAIVSASKTLVEIAYGKPVASKVDGQPPKIIIKKLSV